MEKLFATFSKKYLQKTPKGREEVKSVEDRIKNKVYRYRQKSTKGVVIDLIGDAKSKVVETKIFTLKFKEINYNVLLGASEKYNELKFSIIKAKYPHLKSMKEFLTSDEYLGNSTTEITYYSEDVKGKDVYMACLTAFESISSHIISLKPKYFGSPHFKSKTVKSVIKDKSIYLTDVDKDGGKGVSQINCPNPDYQIDLSKEDWYVFNDNYGTSEEKLFVKFFKTEIEPKLKAKDLEYYVVRNERVPELAIYSFKHGERFEPDYLLFVSNKGKDISYQTYVEPKGNQLLKDDKWKEDFLIEMEERHTIAKTLISDKKYKIIGFPFYNEQYLRTKFLEIISSWIDAI